MASRVAQTCEACQQRVPSRYRALLDLFLCVRCYDEWHATGELPKPVLTWRGSI